MRWQLPALIAAGVALWVDALLGDNLVGDPAGLVLVAGLACVAGWHSRPAPLLATGLGVAALLSVANQVSSPGEFALANDGVFFAVIVLAPAFAGWLLGSRTREVAELRRRTAELKRRRDVAVATARADEAERVERQVDRALAERLHSIIAGIRDADQLATSCPPAVPDRLAQVETTARDALAELRGVLGVLQPAARSRSEVPAGTGSTPAGTGSTSVRRLGPLDLLLVLALVPLAVETSLHGHRGPVWLNVGVSLGQGLALLLVRRRPLLGTVALFALATGQTAVLTSLPSTVSWMLPGLLVTFLLGAGTRRSTAYVGLTLVVAGLAAVILATPASSRAPDSTGPVLVMVLLTWWAGRSMAVRQARAARLRLIADELTRARDEQARLAAAEQRAEMARDLHDVGAHALTVVCLQTGAAQKLWDSDRSTACAALGAVRGLADGVLSHLGASLGGLAGGGSQTPLDPAALEVLAGLGRVLGLDVTVVVRGEPRPLDEPVARAAFRVVQESLTNAARHASYSTVLVSLDYAAEALEVRVGDIGPRPAAGRPPVAVNGSGLGLRGMRERVEACRGRLSCGPSGTGFVVHARLPFAGRPVVDPAGAAQAWAPQPSVVPS